MAERAADYLQRNPKRRMVVLAGSGHLMYGQGIPKRLLRRQRAFSGRRSDKKSRGQVLIYSNS